MSPPIALDLNSTCRLCLSQEGLLPLFSDIESQDENFNNSLPKKIFACVALEVSPESSLPKNICEVCKKSVDDWVKFKEQCDRVNSTLQQFLDSQTSAQYVETLRNNLGGATSALLFSDVDVSLLEALDDGLQADALNMSLSDELLSDNPRPMSASNVSSSTFFGSTAIKKLFQLEENLDVGNRSTFKLIENEPNENSVAENRNTFKTIGVENSIVGNQNIFKLIEDENSVAVNQNTFKLIQNEKLLVGNQNTFKLIEDENSIVGNQETFKLIEGEKDEKSDFGNQNPFELKEGPLECNQPDKNNQYSCELCEEVFPEFAKLLEHDNTDHNTLPKNVCCPVCGKVFLSDSRITHHIIEDNCSVQIADKKRFPCEFCGKDFIKFARLLHHDGSHHTEMPRDFSCQECGKLFISETRVSIHMRHSHKSRKIAETSGKNQYACELCEKVFTKFVDLLKHDDTNHAKLPRNFSCQVCGKLFLSDSRIDVHKRIHGERKFQCSVCDKMFLTSKSLSVHARGHGDKYVCDVCGVRKQSLRMLEDHVRVHTADKPFACQLCGKTFSNKQGKEVHEKHYHQNNKNFKCDVCDYRSFSYSSLNLHKQTHNPDKQFKCEQCDKLFQTKTTYLHHIKLHKESNPTYKCLVCSAVFREKYFLTRHEALHLNLRQFSCYICDKTYNRKDLLRAHIRLHMTKLTHCCEKCKRCFKTQRYLKRHKCRAAVQETVVENDVESQETSFNNPEKINRNNPDETDFVEPQEMIFDNRVVVTSSVDNIENGSDNLNNSLLILNDGSLMLVNPPIVSQLNNLQTSSYPM